MPTAVIAAGIGAAGAIGGALLSSHAQSSAAQQATNATTQAQNQATQAQLQLGRESLDQNANIYKSNFNLLSPFVSNGLAASNSLNAMLNLPAGPKLAPPDVSGGVPSTGTNALAPAGPTLAQIQAMQHDGIPGNYAAAIGGGGGINPLHILSPITNFI